MRSWAVLSVVFGAWACGSQTNDGASTPQNVFGRDDREMITSREYPYGTIGRIETGCTGTLIARNLVLTAAHCVYDGKAGKVPEALGYFNLAMIKGTPSEAVWIQRMWFGTEKPDDERGKDWAILLLAKPVGDTNKWMAINSVDVSTSLPYTVNLAG